MRRNRAEFAIFFRQGELFAAAPVRTVACGRAVRVDEAD